MASRAFICFVLDGQSKTAYYHGGGQPPQFGLDILRWLRVATRDISGLRADVQQVRLVDGSKPPSQADVERLRRHAGPNPRPGDWGDLLSLTAGNPARILEAGVMLDYNWFPADSLQAEWGYVVDLDGYGLFEVYQGFQTKSHQRGRFANLHENYGAVMVPGATYYPVALRAAWPLTALPDEPAFLAAAVPTDGEGSWSPEDLEELEQFMRDFFGRTGDARRFETD